MDSSNKNKKHKQTPGSTNANPVSQASPGPPDPKPHMDPPDPGLPGGQTTDLNSFGLDKFISGVSGIPNLTRTPGPRGTNNGFELIRTRQSQIRGLRHPRPRLDPRTPGFPGDKQRFELIRARQSQTRGFRHRRPHPDPRNPGLPGDPGNIGFGLDPKSPESEATNPINS